MSNPALQRLSVLPQYLAPQHWMSRTAGLVADSTWPMLKDPMISWFINQYNVDMSLAAEPNPKNYPTFNAFFTRALHDQARPLAEQGLICPADGAISQMGSIDQDRILQAKGHDYTLKALLGGDDTLAELFRNGEFATVYLSPRDYHRVHMPITGTLKQMIYVPGRLFSVNQRTAEYVPGLFARNERVIAVFDTERGPMAMVLVGAMIVASIETVWAGLITPPKRILKRQDYSTQQSDIVLQRGAEMGRFLLGSTVIVLFSHNKVRWLPELTALSPVVMGQQIATLI